MISLLKGKVVKKSPGSAVIEAGGVGYGFVPSARAFEEMPGEGKEAVLHIHTHLSVNAREGALELFGFSSGYEKEIFEKLLGVSGVGPRAALKILSCISAERLAEAVHRGDLDRKKVTGLGPKRAAAVMNELKGKVLPPPGPQTGEAGDDAEAVLSVLRNYGFTAAEIRGAQKEIEKAAKEAGSFEEAVKSALSVMRK